MDTKMPHSPPRNLTKWRKVTRTRGPTRVQKCWRVSLGNVGPVLKRLDIAGCPLNWTRSESNQTTAVSTRVAAMRH